MSKRAEATMPQPPYIDRGEPLPRSYAENRLVALVRAPEQIHLFWDIAADVRVAGSRQVVRVHDLSVKAEYDLEPPAEADNWYLHVTANRTYRFELLERHGLKLRRLAVSEEVTTPVRRAGESGQYFPAEIIQAARHPISRKPEPARAARTLLARHAAKAAPAAHPEWPAPGPAPAWTIQDAWAEPAAPDTSEAPLPAAKDAAPVPIPAPREKVFAADYTERRE